MAQQPAASQAPQASVKSLTSKDLHEFPGKEALMILVEYPPGGVDPIHRHKAHAFVYVLEGSIIMQVKSGNEVTLTPGAQTPATRAAIAQANDGLRKAFFKRGKSGS
jgi:quercetin dioxygenase-like cupin family protein